MHIQFSHAEGRVLHGLIAEASGDIVVRLDPAGFIVHASENASELGIDLASLLLMPHIADLAEVGHGPDVARYVAQVFAGRSQAGWIEFPLRQLEDQTAQRAAGSGEVGAGRACAGQACAGQAWYAFSLRQIEDDDGVAQGALGLLRSVQQRHALEGEINNRALTDPLTGLANRSAFFGQLRRSISACDDQSMAVLAVDGLRAIFMQYGQRTADEVQWGFAKFLETMTVRGQELAQLDGERFAVLLPGMSVKQARHWAEDVLKTFAGLTVHAPKRSPELTASAGLARVEVTVDWTMRQAELGLVMARAAGGIQIGICGQPPRAVASGAKVELAMERAVRRAANRPN